MGAEKRADTPEERQRLLEELGKLWNIPPDLRLGQLLHNAVSHWLLENKKPCKDRDVADHLFSLEDDDLLTTVAKFVMEQYPPKASTSS